MPVESCTIDGGPGLRWGTEGKCYGYTADDDVSRQAAHDKAAAQGRAIKAREGLAANELLDASIYGIQTGMVTEEPDDLAFPNEHAARLKTPASLTPFIRVRRGTGGTVRGVKIPESISVIWYVIRREGKEVPVPQALRFPTSSWTVAEARAWLTRNKIKPILFEPASSEMAKLEDYNAIGLGDDALMEDFQTVMLWNTALGDERDTVKSDVPEYARRIIAELVKRNKVRFDTDTMRPESVVLLCKTLVGLCAVQAVNLDENVNG